eukprot:CAMPEP_0172531780 /NCGR_PEP_ID=MMETSP1067-20121228/5038_1 /TAXON_ID=265564 ORGANISM="Thalassiosira punctigera, Strain Tpunct2005C2" /NCGR_SAMPLE_ID=MMETSP1067 /ASSEMBLY_ACC=CAM_ASM_000444 /LENGTH=762 /DNA_ID=CAMNT_0013316197 /DNA_START=113 /DNA_END=2401 /DNA_ORIENTATION=-
MSSSSLKQRISSAFRDVGHDRPLPASVLSHLAALSASLRQSPTQLADAWEAHSLNKNVEALDDASLGGYRNALAKNAGVDAKAAATAATAASVDKKNLENVAVISGTGLGKRRPGGSSVTPSPMAKRANNAVVAASTATPAAGAAVNTPATAGDRQKQKQQRDGLSAVDGIATPKGAASPSKRQQPGSAASVITPPKSSAKKYADRTNAGKVVSSYNPNGLPTAAEVLASRTADERERAASRRGVTVSRHPAARHPESSFRHMFTPLEKRSVALEDRMKWMSDAICAEYNIKSEEEEMVECMDGVKGEESEFGTWMPVGLPKQNEVLCVGRICNEAHEGKLNGASIRLEGSRQHSSGARIHLDLKGLNQASDQRPPQSYSFFPGQIVAVEGINSSGRTMQASRILEGAPPPGETMAKSELLEHQYGAERQDGDPVSIVSMCGPYTTKDNLEYKPLEDAIVQILQDKPDVVVMCGPFVDQRQPLIAGGEPVIQDKDGKESKVSYEHLFAARISSLLEELYLEDPELKTQFVLVPSMDDAFLDAVYPQPPMEDKTPGVRAPKGAEGLFGDLGLRYVELAGREDDAKSVRSRRRVHCVSNPCTLRINDVTLGVTSTDVLFHVNSDSCNANLAPGTRLSRIAEHLLNQRSYYPLFPATKGVSLDLGRAEGWEMPVRPDVLITPSKLASFAKRVCDTTVVVNPGELTKNTTGGTYAVMDIHPMTREALEEKVSVKEEGASANDAPKDAEEMLEKGVQDRVRVDIKRI